MDFFVRFTDGVDGEPRNNFSHRPFERKDGTIKWRLIGEPNDPMRELQTRVREFLAPIAPKCHSSASIRRGIGSVRNARKHANGEFLWSIDFAGAFGSTDGKRLAELIAKRARLAIPRDEQVPTAEEWLAFMRRHLLTRDDSLIEGSCVSPLLLEWYCEMTVDRPIRSLIAKSELRISYSRFVDDLCFSSRNIITENFRRSVRWIIDKAGYRENFRKTRHARLVPSKPRTDPWHIARLHLPKFGSVRVTGPRVSGTGSISLRRADVKAMERMLVTAIEMPLFADSEDKIEGKIRYLLDVIRGKRELNALEVRTLRLYIQWCGITGRSPSWAEKILAKKAPPEKTRNKTSKKSRIS